VEALLGILFYMLIAGFNAMREANKGGEGGESAGTPAPGASLDLSPLVTMAGQVGERADKVREALDRIGPTGSLFVKLLDRNVLPKLEAVRTQLLQLDQRSGADGLIAKAQYAAKAQQILAELEMNVTVLEHMAQWRTDPRRRALLADADAIAYGLLEPFQRHLQVYNIPFPSERPICAPADPGYESIWFGLLPRGYPVIFIPPDYDADLFRHAAVPHELGHLIVHRVRGLREELLKVATPALRDVIGQTASGGLAEFLFNLYVTWREEIFADLFAVLMLGPAGLRGMVHAFEEKEQPAKARYLHFTPQGDPDEHPPGHLRVHLAATVLSRMGFHQEVAPIVAAWDRTHATHAGLLVPLSDGRLAELPQQLVQGPGDAMVQAWYDTQLKSLGDHQLESIPGLEMSPGLWARVQSTAARLLADDPFHGDPRIVLAAAIEARAQRPSMSKRISDGMLRAVLGLDAQERRVADPHYAGAHRHGATSTGDSLPSAVRDALLLREVLGPPAFRQRPGGFPHQRRGRVI
jgi:hypothetical protein